MLYLLGAWLALAPLTLLIVAVKVYLPELRRTNTWLRSNPGDFGLGGRHRKGVPGP